MIYNRADFQTRIDRINEFRPHIALDLHYNAIHEERNEDHTNKGTRHENYSMAFVPGSFMKGELSKKDQRIDFLRILVTEDLDHSIAISKSILGALDKSAGVSPVNQAHLDAGLSTYISRACAPTEFGGVYARNLALTRQIKVPFCSLEPLCQENTTECKRLAQEDFLVDGKMMPNRIKEVVSAYVPGIKDYIQSIR